MQRSGVTLRLSAAYTCGLMVYIISLALMVSGFWCEWCFDCDCSAQEVFAEDIMVSENIQCLTLDSIFLDAEQILNNFSFKAIPLVDNKGICFCHWNRIALEQSCNFLKTLAEQFSANTLRSMNNVNGACWPLIWSLCLKDPYQRYICFLCQSFWARGWFSCKVSKEWRIILHLSLFVLQ